MISELDYSKTAVVTRYWHQPARSKKQTQIHEKWLILGLLGAGVGALAVWVRVVMQVVNDISLAGAAYFGG